MAAYDAQMAAFAVCLAASGSVGIGFGCIPPMPPTLQTGNLSVTPGAPMNGIAQVTPQQVAYMAVAQIDLPTVKPGIGPSPDLNPWHIAVVGYPLWLWADGPTHVGPVSQAVQNLSVSLDAHVSSITFAMGDGNTKTCTGTGTPWHKGMDPATPSPDCGYTYQHAASHPYTVTATSHWTVDWTINGAGGAPLDIPRQSSVQLPVGELQAVNG